MLYDFCSMDPNLLRRRIKERLSEKNLKISHAEKLGQMKAGSLRQFVLGRTNNPTLETLNCMARILDISTADLLHESVAPNYGEKKGLPWNKKTFQEIVTSLSTFVDKAETYINSEEAISILRNFYYSYSETDNPDIDKAFNEWILNKMIGKK